MSKYVILPLLIILFCAANCEKENLTPQPAGELNEELGIEAVPSSLGNRYAANFNRYTKVVAPNGKAIHIVAQSNITNEQIIRCRSILEHFLNDLPGSTYGNDKSEIAKKMTDNNAILTLLNGKDDGKNPIEVEGQALFEEEIQVEGHAWYINQDYNHRDAAYEEILHLVHDYGIGVDGKNSSPGAASEFQAGIRAAQINALNNNLWGIGAASWIKELTKENSLSQEYLAAVIDVYYGLWGAYNENATHGMYDIYVAKTREEIANEDPMGQQLVDNKFFHPYLSYNARIDAGMSGTFSLKFDEEIPYTHHSRYLKDITLLGTNTLDIVVNELDNDITGNEGSNTIIFSGKKEEYQIENLENQTTVIDQIPNRDGKNILRKIDHLQFADGRIDL